MNNFTFEETNLLCICWEPLVSNRAKSSGPAPMRRPSLRQNPQNSTELLLRRARSPTTRVR